LPFGKWIFRNGQPDCDDERRIFVAMTCVSNLCASSLALYIIDPCCAQALE